VTLASFAGRLLEGGVDLVIAMDDPRAGDVSALVERHLAFGHEVTPAEGVFALDVDGLLDPSVTFCSARIDGVLAGIGALKELDGQHAELKSMHTVEAQRGKGIGRAMVDHLLSVAAARGYRQVSLETGTADAFVAARALYAQAGFTPCEPYGQYVGSTTSACMTIVIPPTHTP
jgi:putative acetyltransferase